MGSVSALPTRGVFAAAFALVAVALAGVVTSSSSCDGQRSCRDIRHDAVQALPQIVARVACLAVRQFGHDVGQPRAPRHRSDRPNPCSIDDIHLHGVGHQAIVRIAPETYVTIEPFDLDALAGHPLQLLRPPAAFPRPAVRA